MNVAFPTDSRLLSNSVGLPFLFDCSTVAFAFAAAMTLDLCFSVVPSPKAASHGTNGSTQIRVNVRCRLSKTDGPKNGYPQPRPFMI